tara:strand:+ start:345 stop:497 length:153 start_codon:yes stop_codon:yes gene_type:complete
MVSNHALAFTLDAFGTTGLENLEWFIVHCWLSPRDNEYRSCRFAARLDLR